jgi:rod shape-determining protein MreD
VRGVIYTVLAVVFCALQTTVFEYLKIFGVRPNLLMALVVCVALTRGSVPAGALGLLCGVITDVMSGGTFGVNSLLMFYVGVGVGFFHAKFYRIRSIVVFVFSLTAFFTYAIIYYFLVFYIWGQGDMWITLIKKILPESIYTAVLSIGVIRIVGAVNSHCKIKGVLNN